MLHSAEFFSTRIADELRAMQFNLISKENIFNKNSALCCMERIRLSAIAGSHNSALYNIAGSHDSALCSMTHNCEYLREFGTEFENILGYYSGALGHLIYEKNQRSKIS
jgi:hypothetical protein